MSIKGKLASHLTRPERIAYLVALGWNRIALDAMTDTELLFACMTE